MPICGRCHEEFADRTNKLKCWKCRRILKILKETKEEFAAAPTETKKIKPASFPTKALPGTPEKMDVVSERIAAGESPYHPDDAKPNTQ